MPPMTGLDLCPLLSRHRRHRLSFRHRIVAHQFLKTWFREDERDSKGLRARVDETDRRIPRNVDRRAGADASFTAVKRCHARAAMDEDDLVRDEVSVQLDFGAGCNVFVPHYQVGRRTISAVYLEDEGSFPSRPTHATLSLVELKYQPVAGPDTVVCGLCGCWCPGNADERQERDDHSTSKPESHDGPLGLWVADFEPMADCQLTLLYAAEGATIRPKGRFLRKI